ncbi:MAG: GTP-binding protein [Rhodocyclaceae bacterium]
MQDTIPVTLLTGFLGAGKTTLLNRFLAAMRGTRIAIVENEFGAVGIDGSLVASEASAVVELSDGCICCTVKGALSDALISMAARRANGELTFDRLIIETTGLADPAPIVQVFLRDEILRGYYQLDGVITVIDALHATTQLDRERVAASQVAFADRLILTKTDALSVDDAATLAARLARINARAPLEWASRLGNPKELLAIGGFMLHESGLPRRGWRPVGERSWDDAIASVVLESDVPLPLDGISLFVDELLADHANDLLRYKGILSIADESRRLIFQGVHQVAGYDYGRPWEANETRTSRMVLIGRDLPVERLRARFAALAE